MLLAAPSSCSLSTGACRGLLLLAPLVYLGHRWLAPRLRAYNRASLDSLSTLLSRVGEAIANLRLVKSLGREQQEGDLRRERLRLCWSMPACRSVRVTVWSGVRALRARRPRRRLVRVRRVVLGDLSLGTMLAYFYTLTLSPAPASLRE